MVKKALISMGLIGAMAVSVSSPQIHAAGIENFKESAKYSPLKTNQVMNNMPFSYKSAAIDYLLESEPNNDFGKADIWSFNKTAKGNLLGEYDEDYYKITVPNDGKLKIKGSSNSDNITLAFGVAEKDWAENSKLVFLEKEYAYSNGVEVQAYQAKAGTYYVVASDWDYDFGYDDNTKADFYTLQISYTDNVKPASPTVNKVDNNDKTVTGKAEANSTITVKNSTTTFKTVKATSKGTFSVAIPVQKAGAKLTVTAKDSAGNISSAKTVTVADVIAPSKPSINKVDDNDLKVTGKAEAGSTVVVKAGSATLGSAAADAKGVYSVKIKAQKKGTTLTLTAKDKAGNTSAKNTYVVVKH